MKKPIISISYKTRCKDAEELVSELMEEISKLKEENKMLRVENQSLELEIKWREKLAERYYQAAVIIARQLTQLKKKEGVS